MLKPEQFRNTEVIFYYDDAGIHETDSNGIMDLLESERIDGINHIGIYRSFKLFTSMYPYVQAVQSIVIDYHHRSDRMPAEHNLSSYKSNWETDGRTNICRHTIRVNYPEIKLIKLIHDLGNTEVKTAMRNYVRDTNYLKLNGMESDEAVWFMSIVLGSNEETGKT